MLLAQKYLEIVRKRGEEGKDLKRIYRMLKCKELYVIAYGKISSNTGALTPGMDSEDTVDGMSMKRIDSIIAELNNGAYEWKPNRRTYISKKSSNKKRPLGMPSWSDKLLEEVMKMILEAYYEPQFRESSHGFRPKRGCHTALKEIQRTWTGTKWFIETDIKGCFDNIDHDVLMKTVGRKIKDERFLKLIRGMLKAGYMENSIHYKTYSGTPQGGILSPLLANIVLNELDVYIEDMLIPEYTRGKWKKNPEYRKLMGKREIAKALKRKAEWDRLGVEMRRMPSVKTHDPEYKRLRYVRYADDSILGLNGSREDAKEIRQKLKLFLESIKLEMSEEKTLITHAENEKARFLSYDISVNWDDTKWTKNINGIVRRSVNGNIVLEVPKEVYNKWKERVKGKDGKLYTHRPELLNLSDYDIVSTYECELQGLINYYTLAHNVYKRMMGLRYIWTGSLVRTLAGKHKTRVSTIYKKYTKWTPDGRKLIGVEVKREGKNSLIAVFGRKPVERKTDAVIKDDIREVHSSRNELIKRLMANECEVCGGHENIQSHHIRKLKDLKKRWQGRKEKPEWVKRMIAIRRKTLILCEKCHKEIHRGEYDGRKLK